jgi:aspartyl-tRNA(Asn)/glutamyl-tRNA(Gln) amidotransferase subunit A
MTDFTQCTATELTDLYRTGSVSPVTVVKQVLDKIACVDPMINAFCYTDPDTTLAQARLSEQRWLQRQPVGKLDGIPISIKDLILTQGWPTLCGSALIDPNQAWDEDDAYVTMLRNAGAVLLGKTTTSEFGLRQDTVSTLCGVSRNPWNLKHSPGGSSGGSAAAVAAGLGAISIGVDRGGSIIQPSAFCSVVGYKPTGKSAVGPMARSVSDILLTVDDLNNVDLKNLRIGYLKSSYYNETSDQVDQAVQALQQKFSISTLELDRHIELLIKSNIMIHIQYHDIVQEHNQTINGQQVLPSYDLSDDDFIKFDKKFIELFKTKIGSLENKIKNLHQQCDLIITNSTNIPAFEISDLPPNKLLQSKYQEKLCIASNSWLWNILGNPTITLPVAVNSNGLPVGMQIVGAVGRDDLVLQFAKLIEPLFPKLKSPLFY